MTPPSIAGMIDRRDARIALRLVTGVLLLVASVVFVLRYRAFEEAGLLGIDLRIGQVFAHRWLDTGSMYLPSQLVGPYESRTFRWDLETLPSLYPPNAVLLFLATLVLPPIAWWLVPIGVSALAAWRLRPAPWTWPILALGLVFPNTSASILAGNTAMWVAAAVWGAVVWGWPAVFVALKPSFFPFAFAGLLGGRRAFTIGLLGLAASGLVFLSLWDDYLTAVGWSDVRLDYSIGDLPLVLMPIVAWLGRRRAPAAVGGPPRTTDLPAGSAVG
jgi:hypothetical protein